MPEITQVERFVAEIDRYTDPDGQPTNPEDLIWNEMSDSEKRDFVDHAVRLVNRADAAFIQAGLALKAVKEKNLFKFAGYRSFSDFAKAEFGFCKAQAYRLVDAAALADNLHNNGRLVNNNRQLVFRELDAGIKRIDKVIGKENDAEAARIKLEILDNLERYDQKGELTSAEVKAEIKRVLPQKDTESTEPENGSCENVAQVISMDVNAELPEWCYGNYYRQTVDSLQVVLAIENKPDVNADIVAAMFLDVVAHAKRLQAKLDEAAAVKPVVVKSDAPALPKPKAKPKAKPEQVVESEIAEKPAKARKSKSAV